MGFNVVHIFLNLFDFLLRSTRHFGLCFITVLLFFGITVFVRTMRVNEVLNNIGLSSSGQKKAVYTSLMFFAYRRFSSGVFNRSSIILIFLYILIICYHIRHVFITSMSSLFLP